LTGDGRIRRWAVASRPHQALFLQEGHNRVLVGRNGLGKTMIAQKIDDARGWPGSSVPFRSAPSSYRSLADL